MTSATATMPGIGSTPPFFEQTRVARYKAIDETAGGIKVAAQDGDRHITALHLPGVAPIAAVLFFRTRHSGRPHFSLRLNQASLTRYGFSAKDPAEREWHAIIPATSGGQPTLLAQNNELVLAVSADDGAGEVTFGDVVILYTATKTTVKVRVVPAGQA